MHIIQITAYQPTHSCQLSSIDTIGHYQKWMSEFGPQHQVLTDQCKEDMKLARMLNVLSKSKPTQNYETCTDTNVVMAQQFCSKRMSL